MAIGAYCPNPSLFAKYQEECKKYESRVALLATDKKEWSFEDILSLLNKQRSIAEFRTINGEM